MLFTQKHMFLYCDNIWFKINIQRDTLFIYIAFIFKNISYMSVNLTKCVVSYRTIGLQYMIFHFFFFWFYRYGYTTLLFLVIPFPWLKFKDEKTAHCPTSYLLLHFKRQLYLFDNKNQHKIHSNRKLSRESTLIFLFLVA